MNPIRGFWDREVAPFLIALCDGRYGLKDVQERCNCLRLRILNRYRASLYVDLHEGMPPDFVGQGFCLPTGARFFNGRPEIGIFVPVLMSIMEDMRKAKPEGFKQRFETSIVSGFLHEMDHLALGVVGDPKSIDEIISGESAVWAETCEHTLRLFSEVHGRELCSSEAMYYQNWVACGRNAKSGQWRSFIAKLYGQLDLASLQNWTTVAYA